MTPAERRPGESRSQARRPASVQKSVTHRSALALPMLGSAALHLGLALLVALLAGRAALHQRDNASVDYWSGNTFEVEAVFAPGATAQAPAGPAQPEALAKEQAPVEPDTRVEPEPQAEPEEQAPPPSVEEALPEPNGEPDDLAVAQPEPTNVPEQPPAVAEPPPVSTAAVPVAEPATEPVASGSAAAAEPAMSPPTAGADAGDAGLVHGAVGAPVRVRSLAKAFTRAIPRVFEHDPAWLRLGMGRVGTFTVRLEVDEKGGLSAVKALETSLRPEFVEMLRRLKSLLTIGRFRASAGPGGTFVEVLQVSVAISQRAPAEDPSYGPNHISDMDYKPPEVDKAGRAYVRFNSGRHIEAHVEFRRDLR